MKKVFLITRVEQSSHSVFVEAETSEEATKYVSNLPAETWKENPDYEIVNESHEEITDMKEIEHVIVDRTDGTSVRGDKLNN